MFGAFRPTARLSGGLLWKIPWRLSPHQKTRQRRRLRRVDNLVDILDAALKRQAVSTAASQPQSISDSAASATLSPSTSTSSQIIKSSTQDANTLTTASDLQHQRHGRGPKQGDILPEKDINDVIKPSRTGITLSAVAAEERTLKQITRWKAEMPREEEMLPRDKYTFFDKKVRGFRKGVHKLPKWTRVSQRLNPPGF